MDIIEQGDVYVILTVARGHNRVVKLTNVAYCSTAHDNLLLESLMDKCSFCITKEKGKVSIINSETNVVVIEAHLHNTLYELSCIIAPSTTTLNAIFLAYLASKFNLNL